MPSKLTVVAEQVREWQLSTVSQTLYKRLKQELEEVKGKRPFTPGDPQQTYSDLVVLIAKEEMLENLLPVFTETPEAVAEQLNESRE